MIAVLLVMGACIVALFGFGFTDAAIYSLPLDKFMAEKSKLGQRRVRIEGELVPNTMKKRDEPCEYRFMMFGASKGKKLEVRYPQCIIPDTFRDVPQGGVMVTAEGQMQPGGWFQASLIMAKCSSKYDPETHEMKPEAKANIN